MRADVVTVDDDGVPAERAPAARELLHVVLPHRRPALAERVDVGDAAQVVELVDGARRRPPPTPSLRPTRRRRAARRCGSPTRCAARSARCRSPRRCPGRASRWPRRRTAAAASDGLRDPSRSGAASAARARSNAPASAHAAYRIGAACPFDSTKRSLSGLLRVRADRTASRRRTAPP